MASPPRALWFAFPLLIVHTVHVLSHVENQTGGGVVTANPIIQSLIRLLHFCKGFVGEISENVREFLIFYRAKFIKEI